MTSGNDRSITWSPFDKPTQISQGNNTTTMAYGPDRELISRTDITSAGTTSTVFVGGLYEKVSLPGGDVEERHTVGGNTIVTYTNRTAGSAGTTKTRYLHKDHLGSITVITDETGNEVESFSFDPWGKRRAPTLADLESILGSWSTLTTYEQGNLTISASLLSSSITNKGFTGHEQLDPVGLIHMGGRVYDAEIGRFLSPDPFVQDTTNLQGLNRYSYVQNNPLSYTDPSGYFLKNLIEKVASAVSKVWKAVWGEVIKPALQKIGRLFTEVPGLQAAIVGFTCVASGMTLCAQAQWVMTGLNAAMTAANGGTIGQMFEGFAVAAIAYGVPGTDFVGGLVGHIGEQVGSHFGAATMMGGMISKAQGGKFIDGFKGAIVGRLAGAFGRAAGSSYEAGDLSPTGILGDFKTELRVAYAVKPPASVNTSITISTREIGGPPEFVPYTGPVHTNTYVPTYADVNATNTATGYTSRSSRGGFSPGARDVGLAIGLRSARNFQNAATCAALCSVAIALAPGAALIGASVGALVDYSSGSPITIGSLTTDATISAIISPIGYAKYAGNHPVAQGVDMIRTFSAGAAIETAISN